MMADYLTDEEKAVIANADEHDIPLLPPKVVKEIFGKLLQELEDLKAELFNGMSERFRQSDIRAHRQARIIAVAKEALGAICICHHRYSPEVPMCPEDVMYELAFNAQQRIAEIEGEK